MTTWEQPTLPLTLEEHLQQLKATETSEMTTAQCLAHIRELAVVAPARYRELYPSR